MAAAVLVLSLGPAPATAATYLPTYEVTFSFGGTVDGVMTFDDIANGVHTVLSLEVLQSPFPEAIGFYPDLRFTDFFFLGGLIVATAPLTAERSDGLTISSVFL